MPDGNGRAGDGPLSVDRVHELLAKRRRRHLLYCLYLYATPIGLPDVADLLAEWAHDGPETDRLELRLRIYNSLYHAHVPKLAEAGVVEYDQADDVVDLGENADCLRPFVEQLGREEIEPKAEGPGSDEWPEPARSGIDLP